MIAHGSRAGGRSGIASKGFNVDKSYIQCIFLHLSTKSIPQLREVIPVRDVCQQIALFVF